jgi:hypothetical protein|tara:strand:- start:237 stop:716 length:480 start_codon:yes stop_codon:yes gene_type:complete
MSQETGKETGKECKEYNSLKYRTMIMTGKDIGQKLQHESSQQELDKFLQEEQTANEKQSWTKLSKTERLKKIDAFIKNTFVKQYSLQEEEIEKLNAFINKALERKKLLKSFELSYNEETGMIEEIPALLFNRKSRRFTLNKNLPTINKKSQRKTKKTDK